MHGSRSHVSNGVFRLCHARRPRPYCRHRRGLADAASGVRAVAGVDWVIDLGPGAGDDGGRIIARGTPHDVAEAKGSLTGPYLKKAL